MKVSAEETGNATEPLLAVAAHETDTCPVRSRPAIVCAATTAEAAAAVTAAATVSRVAAEGIACCVTGGHGLATTRTQRNTPYMYL